jgi:tRNA(Ile)-lysidine synthase
MRFSPEALATRLRAHPVEGRHWVGLSGGLDSAVLLHALCALRAAWPALRLAAVHVHHGLHPDADRWTHHCEDECERRKIPLEVCRVEVPAADGGIEAAARRARYAAITAVLESGDALLTAHHRDDQAETVLLQLLRGAGPSGLAAMPVCARLGRGLHLRPLLDFERPDLKAYARAEGLRWMEDPSNLDTRFDRNFLRAEIMPRLGQRWPGLGGVLARVARHQAAVAGLMEALGRVDLAGCPGSRPDTWSVSRLNALDPERRANALRVAIAERGLPMPAERQLQRLQEDVLQARADATPCVTWKGAESRRHRDDLYLMAPLPGHDAAQIIPWDGQGPLHLVVLGLRLEPRILSEAGMGAGDAEGPISIRFRRGGERLLARGAEHSRELKTVLQEMGVPPWLRERVPLLYEGEVLRAVLYSPVREADRGRHPRPAGV